MMEQTNQEAKQAAVRLQHVRQALDIARKDMNEVIASGLYGYAARAAVGTLLPNWCDAIVGGDTNFTVGSMIGDLDAVCAELKSLRDQLGDFWRTAAAAQQPAASQPPPAPVADLPLGTLLNATIRAEKNHTDDASARVRAEQEAEAAANRAAVEAVYEAAKRTLAQQIRDRVPTREIGELVGEDRRRSSHMEAYHALELFNGLKLATGDDSPYVDLWRSFCAWAAAQGLEVEWSYRHDGDGTYSWYLLTVKL